VDVLLPAEAMPKVKVGSRVLGGSTVLAVLPPGFAVEVAAEAVA
jgi:hypothetical protein